MTQYSAQMLHPLRWEGDAEESVHHKLILVLLYYELPPKYWQDLQRFLKKTKWKTIRVCIFQHSTFLFQQSIRFMKINSNLLIAFAIILLHSACWGKRVRDLHCTRCKRWVLRDNVPALCSDDMQQAALRMPSVVQQWERIGAEFGFLTYTNTASTFRTGS